jgi:IclR family acetate operon transcriptional repressor
MNCFFCIMEGVNDLTQAAELAAAGTAGKSNGAAGGVQSIERAFDLLEMLADAGGALGLSELPPGSPCPPSTG